MTLDEFRSTGRDVESVAPWSGGDPDGPGRVYAGNTYIERDRGSGQYPWVCTIINDTRGGQLAEMEEFLYEWAVKWKELGEGPLEPPVVRYGAVIVFKDYVSRDLAKLTIERLEKAALLEPVGLHDFNPENGAQPVWYIP